MLRRARFAVLLLVLSLSVAVAEEKTAEAPGEVTLQILDWDQTQELIAQQKGKIVVLDAWSLSCPPCMKEFPNLVKLHNDHSNDIACMSMSCDYAGIKNKPPEFYKEKVLKFLTKQKATFPNILSNVPSDELFEKLELASIPAVYVYDRDGKLVKRFDNDELLSGQEEFTYKDITKLVNELLKK